MYVTLKLYRYTFLKLAEYRHLLFVVNDTFPLESFGLIRHLSDTSGKTSFKNVYFAIINF